MLVSVEPERGSDAYGHHENMGNLIKEVAKSAGVPFVAFTHYDSQGSENEIPWFFSRGLKPPNIELFHSESNYLVNYIRLNFPEVSRGVVFLYTGTIERLASVIALSELLPSWTFVVNILFGVERISSILHVPQNVVVCAETETAVRRIAKQLPKARVATLPPTDLWRKATREVRPSSGSGIEVLSFSSSINERVRGLYYTQALSKYLSLKVGLNHTVKLEGGPSSQDDRKMDLFGSAKMSLVSGHVPEPDLHELYRKADIGVLPYLPERWRNSPSGHFITLLRFGVVPIVFEGTWMADELDNLGLRRIVATLSTAGLFSAVDYAVKNLDGLRTELQELYPALETRYSPENFKSAFAGFFND